jgi:hypothetical protein
MLIASGTFEWTAVRISTARNSGWGIPAVIGTEIPWFDSAGDFHSGDLHVTERFSRTGPDVLSYEATIEDAKTFAKPFTIRMTMNRHTEKNFQIREHECYGF